MNKLPLSTALLSIVVAGALWYIALLLEGDDQWLKDGDAPSIETNFGRSTRDTPVLGGAAALGCQQAEQEMQEAVDDARYCEIDDDCTIFDYGYPIQCLTSVSKTHITALRLEYREYEESCPHRVYYDCPSEPLDREAVCRNRRCEVELRTLDILKDQTLEHIGVDRADAGDVPAGTHR